MNKYILLITSALSLMLTPAMAQSNNNADEVVKIEHHTANQYREGEIIVKFKSTSAARIRSHKRGITSGVDNIDNIINELGISKSEPLMPFTGAKGISRAQQLRSVSGNTIDDNDLSQLYLLSFDGTRNNVHEAVTKIAALDEVEYAEPNYLVYTLSSGDDSELADCAKEAIAYIAEPLYSQQWGLEVINLPSLWKMPKTTDKRPVIAILDTGVDITHPDLADNIWTNEAEAEGAEYEDDDNNGFADDLHGWDFVNQTPRLGDWNGHGTHCAGIAAAVGTNGIGVTGANPDALIMPITVMQSDGSGDVATIIKGIDYAAANGADVISMSIGGYNYSIAQEQALARAYQTAVLVAAAGNDCKPINLGYKCPKCHEPGIPMYPAAFTFVLGVQASADSNGTLASFSNYDNDGPVFSKYSEEALYNYELTAPGVNIMSTYPGGKYKQLNGTSMACPMAAGAISRLLQSKEYANKELLFGDLINTSNGNMNILATYDIKDEDRKPELMFVTYTLADSLGGDGDNRPDAGETLEFLPTLRTAWGAAENIRFSLEVGENEDSSIVEFIDGEVAFGKKLDSYAKAKSKTPLRFKINKECADGRHIKMRMRATCDNIAKELIYNFTLIAENGVEIGGMITKNTTFYPNVQYIVTSTLAVPEGVTLTIMPGTVLNIGEKAQLYFSENSLVCKGTPEQPIIFTSSSTKRIISLDFNNNTLEYVRFENLLLDDGSTLYGIRNANLNNCVIDGCHSGGWLLYGSNLNLYKCNIYNSSGGSQLKNTGPSLNACNVIGNGVWISKNVMDGLSIQYGTFTNNNSFGNYHILNPDEPFNIAYWEGTPSVYTPSEPCYFGSSREDIVRLGVYDMEHATNPLGLGHMDLSNMLTRPSAEAHGIVWKVIVNGYDAQDEFEQLPPLGVGKHKFEVYFNRPMDISVEPTIAMGVRQPYTQKPIAEDGSWSTDSLVYTAYLTIDGKSGIDGLNRIYVADARDNEYFDIPIEDKRFNVEVAATGSMATGLMAEAGLGKVTLTWETDEDDFKDLLGYNVYRYTEVKDSTYVKYYDPSGNRIEEWQYFVRRDTIIANETVIDSEETTFTDYNVVPQTTYYYTIKQITTSLNSHDLSNVVAATPLTAEKGDANGSMAVDIADVVTEIAYLTNQDPQPFIFEAADINSDNTVNIQDIVGTVNIIIAPQDNSAASVRSTATYTVEDGILYVETPVALGGVQVKIAADSGTEFTALDALSGFEQMGNWQNDSEYLFLAFSMAGKSIVAGKHALLKVGNAMIREVVFSSTRGGNIIAIDGDITGIGAIESIQMRLPSPNPFSTELNIPYVIGKEGNQNVRIVINDIAGRALHNYATISGYGEHSYTWYPDANISDGFYFVSLYVNNALMHTAKVIYRK